MGGCVPGSAFAHTVPERRRARLYAPMHESQLRAVRLAATAHYAGRFLCLANDGRNPILKGNPARTPGNPYGFPLGAAPPGGPLRAVMIEVNETEPQPRREK